MPEYPDVVVYIERLRALTAGKPLRKVRLASPFVLRSVDPPLSEVEGRVVQGYERIGKRIVLCLEDELFLVIHLMIAGRLRWRKPGAAIPRGNGLAGFEFDSGMVLFTEASKKKRASLHLVRGREALAEFDRGGLELVGSKLAAFDAAMRAENHTLKRALTDPRILSGVGNAYSDEILHRARLSPFKQTRSLPADEMKRLHRATLEVLVEWADRTRAEVGDGFPDKVTAFRDGMAVHGRYRQPCPVCGKPVQRIVYAQNEANYCAECQTEGRVLADRSLSRLLKANWPRTLEELEERRAKPGPGPRSVKET
jgi:formamidopyrimidine-DNA glycosylase